MRETWVQSLRQEDTLEKEISIHSSIVAWKIPWTEEPCRLQSMGSQSRTRLSNFTYRPSNRQAQCASRFKETLGSGGRVEALGLLMWSAPDFQKCLGSQTFAVREKKQYSLTTWNTSVLEKSLKKKKCHEATHAASVLEGHQAKGSVQTLVGGMIFMGCLCVQFCSFQRRTPLGYSMKTIEPVMLLFARLPGKTPWAGQRGEY